MSRTKPPASATTPVVTRGLDPRVHLFSEVMDRRVKPGDDDGLHFRPKINLSPGLNPTLCFSRPAHRGRRRSRRRMTEPAAVPDNGIAVEPREAQRPTSLAARTPQAAILGNGDIAVGAQTDPRKVRKGSRKPLAPPGAPSSFRRNGKRDEGAPGASNLGPAERWLFTLPRP